MSKLEELIQELCPDGVEYKPLGDICIVSGRIGFRGYTKQDQVKKGEGALSLSPSNIGENGIDFSNSTYINWDKYNESPEIMVSNGDIIFTKTASVGKTEYVDNLPCKATINPQLVLIKEIKCNSKYLSYVLKTKEFQKKVMKIKGQGTIPTISQKEFVKLTVPVPPLEVQQEIVRLLDDFTAKTAELQAELNKEYEARKKQYEYYRDTLLTRNEQIPRIKLCDIATSLYRGVGIKRDQVTEKGIPCVRYGEIYTTYDTCFNDCVSHTDEKYLASPKFFEHGDILFAITGESVEDIAKSIAYLGHDKCLAGGDIVVMKHNQNPRYLAHVLSTGMARAQKSKGKVKNKVVHSSVPSIEQIEIPLPSLDDQQKYADILDGFYLALNQLQSELPAEIESRQKQYEFYRDKLLTFKELN